MSYDLMVFDLEAAPKNRYEFMKWYEAQAKWAEDHDYNDLAITTPELRNWFMEMIPVFPAMNGPYAKEDEDEDEDDHETVTDYTIGRNVIYTAFAWSVAEQAYSLMVRLAEKHGVGFFDASGTDADILFPINGKLEPIESLEEAKEIPPTEHSSLRSSGKPWWKFW